MVNSSFTLQSYHPFANAMFAINPYYKYLANIPYLIIHIDNYVKHMVLSLLKQDVQFLLLFFHEILY